MPDNPNIDTPPVEVLPPVNGQPFSDMAYTFGQGIKQNYPYFITGLAVGIVVAMVLHLKLGRNYD